MDRGPVDSKGVRRSWRDALFRRDPLNPRRRHEVSRRRPVQVVVLGFVAGIGVGTFLVDTPTFWSGFGQVVILALIQTGGFGVMTMASVLALMLSRKLGLESKFVAAAATRTVRLGDVGSVLRGVLRATVVIEVAVAVLLALRWAIWYHVPPARALWLGVFHSISAFNNAGFALFTDNLVGFASDPWICLPVAAALILGGIGFPVLFEVYRNVRRPCDGHSRPRRPSS